MNTFLTYLLIGLGLGVIIVPIFLVIYVFIRNTNQKRRIKRQIKKGNFLKPIDVRDYNAEAWKNEIDASKSAEEVANLSMKIFKKPYTEKVKEIEVKA